MQSPKMTQPSTPHPMNLLAKTFLLSVPLGFLAFAPLEATSIEIANPSGEINGGIDRESIPSAGIPGWDASGSGVQVINDQTLGSNGNWRFSIENTKQLFQISSHPVVAGAAYSLRFDASTFGSSPPQMVAELYVLNGTSRQVIAIRTFSFSTPLTSNDWNAYQLLTDHGALDAYVGMPLGVQFRGINTTGTRDISVDNVRLDYWSAVPATQDFLSDWTAVPNRIWINGDYWANRLQDWEVSNGKIRTRDAPAADRPRRTIHRLSTRMRENPGNFVLKVHTGVLLGTPSGSFTGFIIGAGTDLDYRGAALVHDSPGKRAGLLCGANEAGRARIVDYSQSSVPVLAEGGPIAGGFRGDIRMELSATRVGPNYDLTLQLFKGTGTTVVSTVTLSVSPERLLGSFGLVADRGAGTVRYWFNQFEGSGTKLENLPEREFGPILSAQYTLSKEVMKMTAQLPPLNTTVNHAVKLETFESGSWIARGTAEIDPDACTATFRLPNWNSAADIPYRLTIDIVDTIGASVSHHYDGTIVRDPGAEDEIVIAGMTCLVATVSDVGGVEGVDSPTGGTFPWIRDRMLFPVQEAADNVAKQNPHLCIFNGDQIYEHNSPTQSDNSSDANRRLDYLYKWYLWCWTWRDTVRNRPSIITPDDHDVYQGNLWGEGGKLNGSEVNGGYTHPAAFVKMVERTQTSHLPDPFDPTPVLNGINVYYAPMVYGRIGIAIIEDRKFKNGYADEGFSSINTGNPNYDTVKLDKPGLKLLGDRQHLFLETWTKDWAGQDFKFVSSQSPFATSSTHHSGSYIRQYFDMDSNGWPQTGRREAVALLRKSFSFHLSGDQHLANVFKNGIDSQGDAVFSFTVPSTSNFYARSWDPGNPSGGRTSTVRNNLGEYIDGFGNFLDMRAVANPAEYYNSTLKQAPSRLHDRVPGYGIVRIRKSTRQFTFEAWPLYQNPAIPGAAPYPGWPLTYSQTENDGRVPAGYLPLIETGSRMDPVVCVTNETTGETDYALRIRGNSFRPAVHDAAATYRIDISYGDGGIARTLTGQNIQPLAAHGIHRFKADHAAMITGGSVLLGWDVEGSASLAIDQGLGDVRYLTINGVGFSEVSPSATTTYTLTSNNGAGGILQKSTVVTVFPTAELWRTLHFTPVELANSALEATLWGDAADPDQDGIQNRFEYLLQGDPLADSKHLLPTSEIRLIGDQHYLYHVYRDLLEPSPEVYTIEVSGNLSAWVPQDIPDIEIVSREAGAAGETEKITVRQAVPIEMKSESKGFFQMSLRSSAASPGS